MQLNIKCAYIRIYQGLFSGRNAGELLPANCLSDGQGATSSISKIKLLAGTERQPFCPVGFAHICIAIVDPEDEQIVT